MKPNIVIIDADILRMDPEKTLIEASARLGIPYNPKQLSWPAGPKPEVDGIWASFWYDSVHKTTGFNSYIGCDNNDSYDGGMSVKSVQPLTDEMLQVYRLSLPFYELLRNSPYTIGIDPFSKGLYHCPTVTAKHIRQDVIDHGRMISKSDGLSDVRNVDILIWCGDRLVPREHAKMSVFDSTVQGGDAVWEGLRVYDGRVMKLEEHLDRLFDSARAMAFANIPSRDYVRNAVFKTLKANGMFTDVHARMTLSRGAKVTSSMNPAFNVFGCSLLIVPEWKPVGNAATYDNNKGIKLITAANRRNSPSCVDSKIHHCNLINNILPKIQANQAGAADALMLDAEGFVSETNATNVFMIKRGIVYTPCADYCLPGITRQTIIEVVSDLVASHRSIDGFDKIKCPVVERRISLAEFHAADEVFTTGTMGEITPVFEIDGRPVGSGSGAGELTMIIQEAYRKLTQTTGVLIPV